VVVVVVVVTVVVVVFVVVVLVLVAAASLTGTDEDSSSLPQELRITRKRIWVRRNLFTNIVQGILASPLPQLQSYQDEERRRK